MSGGGESSSSDLSSASSYSDMDRQAQANLQAAADAGRTSMDRREQDQQRADDFSFMASQGISNIAGDPNRGSLADQLSIMDARSTENFRDAIAGQRDNVYLEAARNRRPETLQRLSADMNPMERAMLNMKAGVQSYKDAGPIAQAFFGMANPTGVPVGAMGAGVAALRGLAGNTPWDWDTPENRAYLESLNTGGGDGSEQPVTQAQLLSAVANAEATGEGEAEQEEIHQKWKALIPSLIVGGSPLSEKLQQYTLGSI